MSDERLVLEVDHHVTSIVTGRLDREAYKELKRVLGYRPENFHWMKRQAIQRAPTQSARLRAMEWDGYVTNVCYNKASCKCHVKKNNTHFSTGLLGKARDFFDKHSIPYRLVDIRKKATTNPTKYAMSAHYQVRDYQQDVINKALVQQRGIIKCATGGGKTSVSAGIIAKLGVSPFVFYVTSKDLLYQAQKEFETFICEDGKPLKVGLVGDGNKDIRDVTIMTVQTAVRCLGGKYKRFDDEDTEKDKTDIEAIREDVRKLIHGAKGYIADEVQHWAAETCQIIADCSENAHYRYGLSATPWRDMGDDLLIDACFGKCIADISASFLIERNYLVKPEIYFLKVDNKRATPYNSYQRIYEEALKNNNMRNEWIAKLATKMQSEGRLVLVLCAHIDHGNTLQSLIPGSVFLNGKIKQSDRNSHLELMRQRKCGVTIATSIFDEGVDVKPLDTLILAGSGKSATRALQRIGRVLRPFPNIDQNIKKSATVIDFYDDCKYLRDHSKARRRIYETEPAFVIKDLKL